MEGLCASLRANDASLAHILVAVRLAPPASPAEPGVVVAVSAAQWADAVAAVQQAVSALGTLQLGGS